MAEPIWNGGAAAYAQVDTITMAGTGNWVQNDTVTVTINGMDLVCTVGASNLTDANVATGVKDAINATAALDGTGTTDVTSNIGGQEIPEFTEVTATVSSGVVTVTGNTKGKPITMTVAYTSSGDDTATKGTSMAATGPNHANNADNWSTGSNPVNSDNVVFDDRANYDCLYGLDFSSVVLASLKITNGFRKTIGLPEINADSQTNKYPEYRGTYLQFRTSTLDIIGNGGGSERIKIDLGSATATTANIAANGRKSGSQSEEANVPPVLLKGTNAANILRVTKGDVGFAHFETDSGHLATLHVGPGQSAVVRLGDGVDLANAALTQSGGTLTVDSTTSSGTIVMTAGVMNIISAAHAAITVRGGQLNYSGAGTITTLTIRQGGNVIFSSDLARTVTNVELFEGFAIHDLANTLTVTNGYDFNECNPKSGDFDIGTNLTLTPSAI